MSSANKKHVQGGMNTTYSNVNTEDERNKKAEELLFQAWETAGYHGQPDEDYYPRTAQETRDMEDLLTQAEAAIDDPSDTELMEVMIRAKCWNGPNSDIGHSHGGSSSV